LGPFCPMRHRFPPSEISISSGPNPHFGETAINRSYTSCPFIETHIIERTVLVWRRSHRGRGACSIAKNCEDIDGEATTAAGIDIISSAERGHGAEGKEY
jgi:hypothetical protein